MGRTRHVYARTRVQERGGRPICQEWASRTHKRAFGQATGLAIHPRDSNLYAFACVDGTVVVQNMHIVNKHQLMYEPPPTKRLELAFTHVESGEGPALWPEDAAACDGGGQSVTQLVFTASGRSLVIAMTGPQRKDSDTPPQTTLATHMVPDNALAPGSRENNPVAVQCGPEPTRDQYEAGEAGTRCFHEQLQLHKKKVKERNKTLKDEWVHETEVENRGDRLLADALNAITLPRGQPVAVVPCPVRPSSESELVLMLWPDVVELWVVGGGALQAVSGSTRRMAELSRRQNGQMAPPPLADATMTCALALVWPGAATGAATGGDKRGFWLVGTSTGELHMLGPDLLEPLGRPLISAGSAARAALEGADEAALLDTPLRTGPTGGITLAKNGSDAADVAVTALGVHITSGGKEGDGEPQGDSEPHSEAALCVGFADGSVRQYRLVELLSRP